MLSRAGAWTGRIVLLALAWCLLTAASSAREEGRNRLERMKMVFFPSAACFFFPDGGALLVDFGSGAGKQTLAGIREHMLQDRVAYRLLSIFGWRPRIDWLIATTRNGRWDGELVELLNSFEIQEIYLPFNTRREIANARSLGKGGARVLLQINLSGYPLRDLSAHETVDIAQSVSGVTVQKLLPIPAEVSAGEGKYSVCLRFIYRDVRVLVASELTDDQQEYLLSRCADRLPADVFYHPEGLRPEFEKAVGAATMIPYDGATRVFTTDGMTLSAEEN